MRIRSSGDRPWLTSASQARDRCEAGTGRNRVHPARISHAMSSVGGVGRVHARRPARGACSRAVGGDPSLDGDVEAGRAPTTAQVARSVVLVRVGSLRGILYRRSDGANVPRGTPRSAVGA